jgi:hypothetical protein
VGSLADYKGGIMITLFSIFITLLFTKWIFWLYVGDTDSAKHYFMVFIVVELIFSAINIFFARLTGSGLGEAIAASLIRTLNAVFWGFVFWTIYYLISC